MVIGKEGLVAMVKDATTPPAVATIGAFSLKNSKISPFSLQPLVFLQQLYRQLDNNQIDYTYILEFEGRMLVLLHSLLWLQIRTCKFNKKC